MAAIPVCNTYDRKKIMNRIIGMREKLRTAANGMSQLSLSIGV